MMLLHHQLINYDGSPFDLFEFLHQKNQKETNICDQFLNSWYFWWFSKRSDRAHKRSDRAHSSQLGHSIESH